MFQLRFKALLPAETTDFPVIWDEIRENDGLKIGAEHTDYKISYDGDLNTGLEILKIILRNPDCKVSLGT